MTFKHDIRHAPHHSQEQGAALPLVAGALVVLLALSAFAVDLGWLYLNLSLIHI